MTYQPLARYLASQQVEEVRLTFREIEAMLDRPLPPSARRHQAWWANTETHSHAGAWMRLGWKTHGLDLGGETVAFRRAEQPRGHAQSMQAPEAGDRVGDALVLRRGQLSPAAVGLLNDQARKGACSVSEAAAEFLNALATEKKRRLFDRFPLTGKRSAVDSVALLREGRDGR